VIDDRSPSGNTSRVLETGQQLAWCECVWVLTCRQLVVLMAYYNVLMGSM